jgi:hypothetical protein
MNKKIILIFATLFILSCASHENLTEEEKEKYRKARIQYEMTQGP